MNERMGLMASHFALFVDLEKYKRKKSMLMDVIEKKLAART